ncbi:MAG: PAS domain S-box protein [Myxococcales bacterium]
MNNTRLLSMLYDLTLAVGGEVTVRPLLTRALQRLLVHTSLPVGVVLQVETGPEPRVLVARAIGDRALTALEGQAVSVPVSWVLEDMAVLRRSDGLALEPLLFERYGIIWRLPVRGLGAIVLLGPASCDVALPLTEVFRPVLENFANAVVLCRANEAHTAQLERDRIEARWSLAQSLQDLENERILLRESDAELRRALAISGTGSWTLDFSTRLIRGSEDALRIVGLPANVPITIESVGRIVHPDDRAATVAAWKATLRGEPYDMEHRLLVAGTTKWVRSRVEIERGPDGRYKRAFGAVQDITAMRKVARELERRENIYGAIARHTGLCVVVVDRETLRFVEFNDSACSSLGYTREEFAQLTVRDLQVVHATDVVEKNLQALLDVGSADFENQHRCKDGSTRDVWLHIQALHVDDVAYIATLWLDITERKRAEAQVHRLSLVAEQSPNAVIITDLHANIEYVNEAFVRTTGYSREEILGKNPRLLRTNKTPKATYEALWATLAAGQHWRGEFINCRKDGTELIESASVLPLWSKDGTITGYVGFKEDVTESRKAEEQLRKLSLVVEQSPESVVITDLGRRIEFVNDAFLRATGYTREEVLGQNPRVLQSGKNTSSVDEEMWATLARGETWRGELVNRRKDGTEYVEQAISSPLRQADGRITHYVAVKADITERKRMAEELDRHRHHLEELVQQRTDELAAIFTALPDLYFRVDRKGVILDYLANRRADLYVQPEVFLGKRMQDVLPQSVADDFGRAIARVAGGERMVDMEYDLPFPDGVRTFEARMQPLGVAQAVLVVRDITERHRFEQDLARARDSAEATNRAQRAFLANMSHEIRTPMNAIIGLTHLVRSELTSPRHHDQLDKVHGAAQHLLSIINDVLDLSKIEAGRMRIEKADFDVEGVIAGVCDLVGESVRAKGLELVVDVDALPTMLRGDSLRLGQILVNFCTNAVKFTACGQVRLRGKVVSSDPAETRVRVEVSDTGIGLTEAQRRDLFQPFQQADLSTTRKYGGTGLGLAIARRIGLLMGGEVGCESVPGQGSTFWIEAPFGTVSSDGRSSRPSANVAGRRVLMVDDLADAREVLAEIFSSLRVRVDAVPSGEAALAAVTEADRLEDPYEIVMIDWKMPGLDGLQTGRQLGGIPLTRRPLLLLVSAEPGVAVDDWRGAGFAGALTKPIAPSRLLAELGRFLGDEATSEEVRASEDPVRGCLERAQRCPIRILLAEDNELNREVTVELLHRVGLCVDWAKDGMEAVRRVQERRYDLILMDIQMPELNGLEATRRIRALPEYVSTPILAMTASAFDDDSAASLEAGMNDHIAKPVDPKELYRVLLRWWPEVRREVPETAVPGRPVFAEAKISTDLAAIGQRLDGIEGLNLRRGLRSVGGSLPTLLRILRQFRDLHRDDAEKLESLLQAGDRAGARRVAHSLTGVAGLVGMTELQSLATAVDLAFKKGGEDAAIREQASAMGVVLRRMVGELDVALPVGGEKAGGGVAVIDWQQVADGVGRLGALLDVDDTAVNDLYAELEEVLVGAVGQRARELGKKIESFDYAGAREVVGAMLEAEVRLRKE